MSYFPCDIPFMSKEELKENGITIHRDTEIVDDDMVSKQAVLNEIDLWIEACEDSGHKESASDLKLMRNSFRLRNMRESLK